MASSNEFLESRRFQQGAASVIDRFGVLSLGGRVVSRPPPHAKSKTTQLQRWQIQQRLRVPGGLNMVGVEQSAGRSRIFRKSDITIRPDIVHIAAVDHNTSCCQNKYCAESIKKKQYINTTSRLMSV
ncbi:unnamed protein product [Macrosiphum euphorbiae]|uniref:Uncharacterized protein n=1 Tax=Macrosiphum euphorbiae TaxID=13131 RepID=A0AAV0WC68_9HEMI|nr:unnamed protein product [Macrosiphum euphorbiae]